MTRPESRIASVRSTHSRGVMPLRKTAMVKAAICASLTLWSVIPRTKD